MATEADAIAAMARKGAAPTIIKTAENRELLILPEGARFENVTDEHGLSITLPRYIKQSVTVQTQDSLVEYVNKFKGSDTLLFADMSNSVIAAAVDYHAAGKAAHSAHRATLSLPFSEEWRLWTGISGKLVPQLEFARFLEENGADVRAPDAAELLEAARDLQTHRKVNFIKAVRTASENENFEFTDETTAKTKAGLELPTKFTLGIPVYFGESDTEIFAFLRWAIKPDEGQLSLGIQLHRAEHVRQAVFKQIVEGVASRTSCVAVFGKI